MGRMKDLLGDAPYHESPGHKTQGTSADAAAAMAPRVTGERDQGCSADFLAGEGIVGKIIAATLFSGIGAPEVSMPHWQWPWHAEIEKFPSAVMSARHPQSVNLGDVTADDFTAKARSIAVPDVLVFGSPCQSYSVAGKRLGLDDPRGNLALVALGIVARLKPTWFCFENVPGLLSSAKGRDFGLFLRTVDELGYHVAWTVLDAQYFGVAQRRARVFAVGHIGDWRGPAAVLLEPESLQGNHPPRREAGKGTAVCPTLCAGGNRTGGDRPPGTNVDTAESLIAWGISSDCFDRSGEAASGTAGDRCGLGITDEASPSLRAKRPNAVAHTLNARGGGGRQDFESETLIPTRHAGFFDVAHSLRADGFDASEDGTGRGTPLVYGFEQRERGDDGRGYERAPHFSVECAPTVNTVKPPAIAVDCKASGRGGFGVGEVASTMRAMGHSGSHQNGGGHQAVALDLRNGTEDAVTQTIQAAGIGTDRGGNPNAIPHTLADSAVRRLTPRECERLQGFPDSYTAIPFRGKPAADGNRYKALGNSMAVPCVRWILSRIEMINGAR